MLKDGVAMDFDKIDEGYADGLHREALIATSVVLFFFILIINFVFMMTKKKA